MCIYYIILLMYAKIRLKGPEVIDFFDFGSIPYFY